MIAGLPRAATADHVPVLLAEVVAHLVRGEGVISIDGTFGAGGYTCAILEATGGRVIAIDRDPAAIRAGRDRFAGEGGRVALVQASFGALDEVARAVGVAAVDNVVLDIGVSSMQLDQPERGFSFQADGPLDMRMSQSGPTAADLVATLDEAQLADLIFRLGEERRSRAIARAIVRARIAAPIETTRQLAAIVAAVPGTGRDDGRHPATRTFQALRIAVNDELGELARGLVAAERILRPGGRLIVVTFHSLEDRIAKQFLQITSGRLPSRSRHVPQAVEAAAASFEIVNRKPLTPGDEEIRTNPRARSAKLRVATRTPAPALEPDPARLGVPVLDLRPSRRRGAG